MGKRVNLSQTTVIQTMLTPLSDSFSIQPSDTLEQWYYVNTGAYSPDRQTTPLILTPTIYAVDEETGLDYRPTFTSVNWYVFDPSNSTDYSSDQYWPGLHWVRVTAVEASTGGVLNDYYCPPNSGGNLVVQKNVPPTIGSSADSGQNICCVAVYADPRDVGVLVQCRDNVLLVTNQDATSDELIVNILAPTTTLFNVITSGFTEHGTTGERQRSIYTFQAQVLNNRNQDVTSQYYLEWYGRVDNGQEVLINTLPCYSKTTQQPTKGQGTDTVKLDAIFVEDLDIIVRLRKTSTSAILPFVGRCSLVWEFPDIDPNTVCETGRAVDITNRDMIFSCIVNIKGNRAQVISDAKKAENFLFHYVGRKPTGNGYVNIDLGWGLTAIIESRYLRQTTSYSTPVHTEVYTLGAYKEVTDGGSVVTDDGEVVLDRMY